MPLSAAGDAGGGAAVPGGSAAALAARFKACWSRPS